MKTHTITLIIGIFLASTAMIVYPEDRRETPSASYAENTNKINNTLASI
ncbi:MAG: hypothetical protein KAH20_08415 [Methylococcales bacterium]|nr:hypothetical protein [Methylococcales bacterium]